MWEISCVCSAGESLKSLITAPQFETADIFSAAERQNLQRNAHFTLTHITCSLKTYDLDED